MNQIEISKKQINNTYNQVRNFFRAFFPIFNNLWSKLWGSNAPDFFLFLISLFTSLTMSIPIIYVIFRSLFAGKERWLRLLDLRLPSLLWNTLSLSFAVTFFSVIIGVPLAFIVNRFNFKLRLAMHWILALPIVIPPYVGAVTYIIILGPRGWVSNQFGQSPINIYSFWGALFVLTMFTYPYVFLICGAALKRMNKNFEDAARIQGLSKLSIFWKVTFPLLRPSIGAGSLLVFLYVLSDFGAVSMLRYSTFTSAIYYQMGSYDNLSAAILSMVLILITLIVLWLESRTRQKQKYYQTSNGLKISKLRNLGVFKVPVYIFISIILFLSFILPVTVLLYWTGLGVNYGVLNSRFWGYVWNSFKVAGIASIFCMFLSLPIIYLKSRYKSFFSILIDKLSYSGYALPGVIVALGLIFVFNRYIPWLYNTFFLISVAYIIRFLPQSMQSAESSISQISPRIDEAARNLGYPPWKTLCKVIIPLIAPGVLAGGALVFVNSLKELPATLILRPPGFDTLSVRIWVETSESIYYLAAPAALIIILLSIIPLKWMLGKY